MAKGDDKKTVTDMKRGKAADDHQVPVDGDTSGDNSFVPSGSTIDEFMAVHDEAEAKTAELKEKMRLKCEPERQKIKEWKDKVAEAKEKLTGDGYSANELNVLTADRKDELKRKRRREELDPGQVRKLKAMEKAWKDFRSTPLGEAAEDRELETQH